MPAASIISTNTTAGSGAATNKTCNLPTSILAGDLLLLALRSAGADTHSTPTDWTQLFLNNTADASDDTTSLWYRQSNGSDGSTVIVNGTASLKFASISWKIRAHRLPSVQAPEFATLVTGSNTTPNPGTVTPAGGSNDFLLIWLGGWEGEQTSPPASTPTNYSNAIGASSGTAGAVTTNCRLASASRQATVSSEDPDSWTISVTDDWTATVIAVHPDLPYAYLPKSGASASQQKSQFAAITAM